MEGRRAPGSGRAERSRRLFRSVGESTTQPQLRSGSTTGPPAGSGQDTAGHSKRLDRRAAAGNPWGGDGTPRDNSGSASGAGAAFSAPHPTPRLSLTSVVICTAGQNGNLHRTIASILDQSGADLELVVVDNRPVTGLARHIVSGFDDPRLRYVVEPVAGLSTARNTGIRHTKGSIIAFTDDDCIADHRWVSTIRSIFDRYPVIACVTGKTIALGEMSLWERLFEEFGSFDRGDERLIWRLSADSRPASASGEADTKLPADDGVHSTIFPYTGVFGSGNNMAFRASVFSTAGLFDEALGAGTPAGGGEDLDMFIRLVLADGVLMFEPNAVVQHQHRGSGAALRSQIRTYGSGLSAMMTKQLMTDRTSWRRMIRRLVPGVVHMFKPSSAKNSRKGPDYPARLTLTEWFGVALGPWLYLRGRWAVRRRRPDRAGAANVQLVGSG